MPRGARPLASHLCQAHGRTLLSGGRQRTAGHRGWPKRRPSCEGSAAWRPTFRGRIRVGGRRRESAPGLGPFRSTVHPCSGFGARWAFWGQKERFGSILRGGSAAKARLSGKKVRGSAAKARLSEKKVRGSAAKACLGGKKVRGSAATACLSGKKVRGSAATARPSGKKVRGSAATACGREGLWSLSEDRV